MNIPERMIPIHLDDTERAMFIEEVFTLWSDCVSEYFDPEFIKRTHGSHKTYQAGCKGPFCLDAMRRQRRKGGDTVPAGRYLYIEPLIDFFMEEITNARDSANESLQQELLRINLQNGTHHAVQ